MAKNKISEWSSTPANNTDIGGIDIAEGCAPSGINNAIRELMAQVKDMQAGTDGDNFTVGGNLSVTGNSTFTGSITFPSSVALVPSGVIVMWSGSIATIPSGWYLCNGSNGTPDLRNRFVVGAYQDNSGVANTTITGSNTLTGGSKDAIVVAHTHTGTTSSSGSHSHTATTWALETQDGNGFAAASTGATWTGTTNSAGAHTHTFTTDSTGSSGTDANLVPYYALAFIMKA